MFFKIIRQRSLINGVRFNSTTSKVQSAAGGIFLKVGAVTAQAGYWAKVVGELGKQIYVKEGLAPPKLKEFETVYKKLYSELLGFASNPAQLLEAAKSIKVTKDNVIQYGVYGVQLVGLFSLGEIIGRRKLFGYPSFEAKH